MARPLSDFAASRWSDAIESSGLAGTAGLALPARAPPREAGEREGADARCSSGRRTRRTHLRTSPRRDWLRPGLGAAWAGRGLGVPARGAGDSSARRRGLSARDRPAIG